MESIARLIIEANKRPDHGSLGVLAWVTGLVPLLLGRRRGRRRRRRRLLRQQRLHRLRVAESEQVGSRHVSMIDLS